MLGAAVVLLAAGAILVFQAHKGNVPVAQAACGPQGGDGCMPAFEAVTLDGTPVTSAALAGKVVLVNFWATWCGPCVEEMPALETVYGHHKDEGFVIVGVLADRASDRLVRTFLERMGISYPIVRSTGAIESRFGYPQVLPTSFLYDRQGRQSSKWNGGISQDTLEGSVRALLTK